MSQELPNDILTSMMLATNNASYAIHSRTESGSEKLRKRKRKHTEAPRQRSGFRKTTSNFEEVKGSLQNPVKKKTDSQALPHVMKTSSKKLPTRDWIRS